MLSFGYFSRAFIARPERGAAAALNDETVFRTSLSAPFFHLDVVALPTSITNEFVPGGTVADTTLYLGISALVLWLRFENPISTVLYPGDSASA
mmetsp:Transcript_38738/g.90043  ORF Transcript_38738/g.90043 Transcript_38738/m.90043 type:complete len:94 (+) Transcript_38738:715-996(+)